MNFVNGYYTYANQFVTTMYEQWSDTKFKSNVYEGDETRCTNYSFNPYERSMFNANKYERNGTAIANKDQNNFASHLDYRNEMQTNCTNFTNKYQHGSFYGANRNDQAYESKCTAVKCSYQDMAFQDYNLGACECVTQCNEIESEDNNECIYEFDEAMPNKQEIASDDTQCTNDAPSVYVNIAAVQLSPASSTDFFSQRMEANYFTSNLSTSAPPFIPKRSRDLMDKVSGSGSAQFAGAKSAKIVATSPDKSGNKSSRKKHTPSKWSKQNGRDEYSSNEDLATCSGAVANASNYDEDPGVVDDVNTSESESSPKIRRKHKKKSSTRHRVSRKTVDESDENKENHLSTNLKQLDVIANRFMTELNRCRAITPPLREHIKLNLPEHDLYEYLLCYTMHVNELKAQGYPYWKGSQAGFFKKRFSSACVEYSVPRITNVAFDVNAREFVPNNARRSIDRKLSCDSGQATGSSPSSPPSTDSDSSDNTGEIKYNEYTERKCVRCSSEFYVNDSGEYYRSEKCTFHWGKLERPYSIEASYACCGSAKYSKGCTIAEEHVWNGYIMGFNGPYDDFVSTDDSSKISNEEKVFALDCEMCYTGKGLEVTKVTLVSSDGQKAYERFVRPATKIIDYNTRFSGITKKDLATKTNMVATLSEVQQDLLNFINADTILIGHALENDLRVLKIIHNNVIDTSVTFSHESGPGYKHSLRFLTSKYLNRTIQVSNQGHSSFEDSRACLELMLFRVRKDFRSVLENDSTV